MTHKAQQMVLFDDLDIDRFDTLRVVTMQPRAEVIRQATQLGLVALENRHAERIERLHAVAHKCDLAPNVFVRRLIDACGRKITPPLESLEGMTVISLHALLRG